MKAKKKYITKTIAVNGETIKIKGSRITRQANFMGWRFNINGIKYEIFGILEYAVAEASAYSKYIKENR